MVAEHYGVFVFDRYCNCIFRSEYVQRRLEISEDENAKLIYGSLHSLKLIVSRLRAQTSPYLTMSTTKYRMHIFESMTALRIVLLSSLDCDRNVARAILRAIYSDIYLAHVVRNPLAAPAGRLTPADVAAQRAPPGLIRSNKFRQEVDRLIHSNGASKNITSANAASLL